jgi:hypothetical protein
MITVTRVIVLKGGFLVHMWERLKIICSFVDFR